MDSPTNMTFNLSNMKMNVGSYMLKKKGRGLHLHKMLNYWNIQCSFVNLKLIKVRIHFLMLHNNFIKYISKLEILF